MKFLLAISSKEYSEPTLKIGSMVARAFKAHLSVIYVGEKPKEMFAGRVHLSRDTLAKWEIYHPGVEVLRWAFQYLQKTGYLPTDDERYEFDPANMVEEADRFRVVLPGPYGKTVALILREGDIINELRREAIKDEYILSIIGGSKKRRMAHNIIQYIPTSIFVVKNADAERDYKLLLLVDDSKATKRAVRLGATIAKSQGMFVNTLTVSKRKRFGPGYKGAAKSAANHLKKQGVDFEQHFLVGDPVSMFVDFAGEDHIIVMGVSGQSPIKKFFVGSKPIKTLDKAQCPILIIK